MRGALGDLLGVFKDLLRILSWFETWVPSLVALGVIGFWSIFVFALYLPNPWRSLLIWGLIFGSAIFTPRH